MANEIERLSVAIEANIEPLLKGAREGVAAVEKELKDVGKAGGDAFDKGLGPATLRSQKKIDDLKEGTRKLGNELDETAKSAMSLEDAIALVGKSGKYNLEQVDDEARQLDAALKQIKRSGQFKIKAIDDSEVKKANALTAAFGKLKGVIAGFITFAAIRSFISGIKQATDAAVELNKTQQNLANSANAASAEFGKSVGTSQSWKQTVSGLREEFKVFSEQELNVASAQLVDMTKRLGLSEAQMVETLRRTADLSAGKTDLNTAISAVVSGLQGESRALNQFGISLDDTKLQAYAESQGLVWENLSESEKTQLRYNLFLSQTNELQGRAADYADTLAGSEEKLNAKLEDQVAVIGEQLLPLREGYVNLLTTLSDETEKAPSLITKAMAAISASMIATGVVAIQVTNNLIESFKAIGDGLGHTWDAIKAGENPIKALEKDWERFNNAMSANVDFGGIWNEAFDQLLDGYTNLSKDMDEVSTPGLVPLSETVDEASKELEKIIDKLGSELLDLQEKTNEALQKNLADHQEKMADIEADGAKKRLEINEKYDDQLVQGQAKILTDARDDLDKLEADTDRKLEERRDDYNRDELRETQDHLRDMRDLRNGYLMDIEDAVKNRDARALRDAKRRYEEEQRKKEEQFQISQSRDRQDQDLELQKVRDDESRRADEIIKQRTKALQDLDWRIEESRRRDLERLDESLEEQRQREVENFNERQSELEQALVKRLEAEAKALADQEDINEDGAKQILSTLAEYFGVGGEIDKLMEAFSNRRRQKIEIDVEFKGGEAPTAGGGSPGPSGGGLSPFPQQIPAFQHGGSLLATKPTLAQFGEVPEMVTFTPLSKMGQGRPQQLEVDLKLSGSAPPGIRSADRDAIAGVLANALREAGVMIKPGGR